ncbi:response regulator [Iodobacter sp. CM08]|uniref:HD domain-containing phosphohydrolase n=1 Tax=Iodobacter sp. CM08 TaxID=3085902 RepID=UPI002981540F|nr:HD domain-containing phosphohydrolase [Iodobacter sp. CM08]MDW5415475.1 response regulator [Iodobacter sp. CM08]
MQASIHPETAEPPVEHGFTVLCVDDEVNILAALRRLLRKTGHTVLTAESGAAGLLILAQEKVDLIISDMRMPEMTGAEFLASTLDSWPDTARILLTGYADIHSTIDAINKARINRYVSKPWDDEEMLRIVDEALAIKRLEKEKAQLNMVVIRQNEELQKLNNSLESQVKVRTAELELTMLELNEVHEKLKKGFITSIRVFANLMEMRADKLAGHARVIADLARQIARQLKLPEAEVQDTFIAGLLHSIGKIGLPDSLLAKPYVEMNLQERNVYGTYPSKGHAALMALEQLQNASQIIRSQHERYDGLGFPDKLGAAEIPLGARILSLCRDFEALQAGFLTGKPMPRHEAISNIESGSGKRYDPKIVEAFCSVVAKPENTPDIKELRIKSKDLKPLMILARDLIASGVMLLAKDHVLDERLVNHIRAFELADSSSLDIYIQVK